MRWKVRGVEYEYLGKSRLPACNRAWGSGDVSAGNLGSVMQIRQVIRTPLPTIPSEYWLAGPLILEFVGWLAALGTYKIVGFRWEVAAVWAVR